MTKQEAMRAIKIIGPVHTLIGYCQALAESEDKFGIKPSKHDFKEMASLTERAKAAMDNYFGEDFIVEEDPSCKS
jgi:hypothetical protein